LRKDYGWTHRTEVQKIQQRISGVISDFSKDGKEDKALIKDYINGSQEAGRALIENYLDIISIIYNKPSNPPKMRKPDGQRFITRPPVPNIHDKEDVLQEILYQFFTLVYEYDESFKLPFYALIKGKLFLRFHNQYYREYFEVRSKEREYVEEFEVFYGFDEIAEEEEVTEKVPSEYMGLYEALNKLSKQQREVIQMSVIKGWNSTVIAQELNINKGAVRVRLTRGLAKLRIIMATDKQEVSQKEVNEREEQ